jgi:hypothetical protein
MWKITYLNKKEIKNDQEGWFWNKIDHKSPLSNGWTREKKRKEEIGLIC